MLSVLHVRLSHLLFEHPPTPQSPEALLGAFSNMLSAKMVTNGPHSACNLQQQGTFMRLNYVQDCKGLWGAGRKVGFEDFAARTRERSCERPLDILEPSYRRPRWLAVMGVSMPRLQTAWSCKLRYMISQLKFVQRPCSR